MERQKKFVAPPHDDDGDDYDSVILSTMKDATTSEEAAAAPPAHHRLGDDYRSYSLPGRVSSDSSGTTSSSGGSRTATNDTLDDSLTEEEQSSEADESRPCSPCGDITMATIVVDVQECGGAEVTLLRTVLDGDDDDEDEDAGPAAIVDADEDEDGIPGISPSRNLSSSNTFGRAEVPIAVVTPEKQSGVVQRQRGGSPCSSNASHGRAGTSKLSSLFCGVADTCSIVSCSREDAGSASPPLVRKGAIGSDRSLTPEYADTTTDSSTPASTPIKSRGELAVVSPPPPPSPSPSDQSPMGSKLSCGPRGCWRSSSSDAGPSSDAGSVTEKQRTVEETIGGFLGSPAGTSWCDGWQAWSIHMTEVGVDEEASSALDNPMNLKKVLRNRAGDLDARRRRIRCLRRDLSPFDLVANRNSSSSGVTGPVGSGGSSNKFVGVPPPGCGVRKANSFSVVSVRSGTPPPPGTDVASSVVSMTSSVLDTMQNCGETNAPLPPRGSSSRTKRGGATGRGSEAGGDADSQDDLCYDSDPGEVGPSGRSSRRRNLKRDDGGDEVQTLELSDSRLSVESFLRQGGTWASDLDAGVGGNDGTDTNNAVLNPTSDVHMSRAIDEILHRRMTLVWHRASDGNTKDVSPVAVYAWIELGSQLRSALIQPKLIWKAVRETQDERGSLGITNLNLHSVDLLDISRVLMVNRIDRKRYPLAKRRCSLSIETFDHNVLFEASCEGERDLIVRGTKGLVARLASKIIVGDDRVFDEFFTPFGAAVVPGEPPRWAS